MTEHAQSKSSKAAIGCGISFQPALWERLEAESSKLERPNRSLIVERALLLYFAVQDQKRSTDVSIALNEGAA